MARNGSGTYSKVNTFASGATVTASGHNQNWDDLVTEMTNSVAADGQTTITGALKGADGTVSVPSYSFSSDSNTGIYHIGADNLGIAANGAKVLDIATAGLSITGTLIVSGAVTFTTPLVTAGIAASAVTYAKIQNVADQRMLANFSGAPAAPSEYSVVGPVVNASAITFPYPPPAAFKNLSIKVATTTTVAVAADFVAVTDGTNFQTKAFSGTINLATTGANALDTGTVAIDTWYAIWCIAKADGTTAVLASTSATAPTMPTGYTYKARVGWVRTIHASATLYGTWQLGRNARYIVGLAQTTTLPAIATGAAGAYSSTAPTWVAASISSLVPTATAVEIIVRPTLSFNGGSVAQITVAPSSSYLGWQSSSPPPYDSSNYSSSALASNTSTSNVTMMIESTNIYWTSANTSGAVFCVGWEDNI